HQAHNAFQRGGFTGTIAAQQGNQLVFIHLQRHILQDMAFAIKAVDVIHAQHQACPPVIMLPRYAWRTLSLLRMASGGPSTSTRPCCITVMVSDMSITMPMLCSISTTVHSDFRP